MCCTASAARRNAPARQAPGRHGPRPVLHVIDGGQRVPLDMARCKALIESACAGLGADVKAEPILAETRRNLYDGVPMDEVYKAAILAARTLIEKDPDYTRATARLLLHTIRREVLGERGHPGEMASATPTTSRSSSRRAWPPSCSTSGCCSSTWPAWAPR
jgi:ribonucleoside-diphosphate reductase alpha chain